MQRYPLWQLGFRPFYLLAGIFATLAIPLWALQFSGLIGGAHLTGPVWHAHEMLFGFALAVVVGFLFTAARNWTNQPTPTGAALAAICALWLAARVLILTPFDWAAALANVGFPLAAAAGLIGPLRKARNSRNYFFVGLLALMAVAAALVHLSRSDAVAVPAWAGLTLGLDVLLFIVCVMGGRVIPMFTNNGVPGAQARRHPWVERAALGLIIVLATADALGAPARLTGAIAAAAGVAHALRWLLWQPWRTTRNPLVWVLHASYAWIPVHLVLRCLAAFDLAASSLATHALTTGAIAGMIIGMMTRTARGHTARPLRADRFDTACYLLVLAAGVVRVGLPLIDAAWLLRSVQISAVLWSAGFGLFVVRYWPVLTRARLDGRAG
ncbi:MAG: NnrS family protein [Lautropia sp.]